jgi:hypothetical protein
VAIVIGCSGSTGSSLLKTILNRHSQIFAGPETELFAFPQVYTNWEDCKKKLLHHIKNDDWQIRKGMSLLQTEYAWKEEALLPIIAQSASFLEFVTAFFKKPLAIHGKQIWVEKTPANAAGLSPFLNHCPHGKAVQTIRNPYDTIASLMARGINAYAATAYYVYNTSIATSNLGNENYYHLKYEDLVAQPILTLNQLFSFLNIPFEADIVNEKNEQRAEPDAMPGWKHRETEAVKKSSIGRFYELEKEQQELIKAAFASFRINDAYLLKKRIKYADGKALCTVLDYEFLEGKPAKYRSLLQQYYWRDRLSRLKHGFWWQSFNYLGHLG